MKADETTYQVGDRVWINDAYGNFHAATVTGVDESGELHAIGHGVFGEAIRFIVPAGDVADCVNGRD